MITRTTVRFRRFSTSTKYPVVFCLRSFFTTPDKKAKNKIFTPVRRLDDFETYKLLSSSSRVPLLTFWTASYCATCRSVSPILEELIKCGVGEEEGGVSFCEIEYDSPDVMGSGLGMTYMITSIPTLLSFDRGEAQLETKVTDPKQMKNKEWLKQWIRTEAERRGSGGSGGHHPGTGMFGGLFGSSK